MILLRILCRACFLIPCLGLSAEEPVPRFDPVQIEVAGWPVHIEPALLAGGEEAELGQRALQVLEAQLVMIRAVLDEERVAKLQTCPIWLEVHHPAMGAMQYHPSRKWLLGHGHDPRLEKMVHVPRARNLVSPGMMRKNPWVVMHELAHAYHDRVVGHEHEGVKQAWAAAVASGKYEEVLLYNGRTVRHYALSNIFEYFAEATEAYVGSNDFYPFVRAELKAFDPAMYAVMQELWGRL